MLGLSRKHVQNDGNDILPKVLGIVVAGTQGLTACRLPTRALLELLQF